MADRIAFEQVNDSGDSSSATHDVDLDHTYAMEYWPKGNIRTVYGEGCVHPQGTEDNTYEPNKA